MIPFPQKNLGVVASIETITPIRAEEYLARSQGNRSIRQALVDLYSSEMRTGRWKLNGQPIHFDVEGRLQNGHHRLNACIKAGVPFPSMVVRGLDPEVYDTHDTGAKRTAGDVLGMSGCINSTVVAAAIKLILNFWAGRPMSKAAVSASQIREFWQKFPQIEQSVSPAALCKSFLQPGVGTALHFLFVEKNPSMAAQFFSDLADGSGLADTDAVFVLREGLIRARLAKAKLPTDEVGARVVRAWQHRRQGTPCRQIKGIIQGNNGPVFPEIV